MGDDPHPYASTAAGERHNSNHQLPQGEISIPYFHSNTLASDLQFDYFSRPFHGAARPQLSFSDSETDSQLDMDAFSEEGDEYFLGDDQVSFITNLFEPRQEDANFSLGLALGLGQIDEDMGERSCAYERNDITSEAGLELGLGLGMVSDEFTRGPHEFAGLSRQQPTFLGGLRVTGIDSDSDSDQNLAFDSQIPSHIRDFHHPPFCLDYLGFNQQRQNQSLDFDWLEQEDEGEGDAEAQEDDNEEEEEVVDATLVAQNGLHGWYYNVQNYDEADDRLHFHSDSEEDREIEDSFEEVFQGLEWEILVAVNNLNRDLEDDTMFDVVEESMNEWRGNPPAAKSVVESLAVVHLSHDNIKENEITCTICWSEISANEPLRQLPCRHYYHGECIMSWLDIRNTCPVCRYELPTDDLEYEYQKREMDAHEGGGLLEDLPVSYENFHVFL